MKRLKIINILFLVVFFAVSGFSQSKTLQKANKAYKLKNYAQAIPLYEEVLGEKESFSSANKLANCYFKLNKLDQAKSIYAKLVTNERAKAQTFFNYAQTLMSSGDYEEAKQWFRTYQKLEPDDEHIAQLIQACDDVKTIKPYFPYVKVDSFPFNSPQDDNAPVFYKDGIVFSSDRKAGVKLLKQKSGMTGNDFTQIYYAKYDENGEFKNVKTFAQKLNALNRHNAYTTFPEDYSEVYFTRNSSSFSRSNAFNMQLFSAKAAGESRWKGTEIMDFCNNEYNYMHPALSPDGKKLFFVSNKPGGEGDMDIYLCIRKEDGTWGKPRNLGPVINTPANEGFPFAYYDNKLFFCSKGHAGFGGFDIFVSELIDDKNWTKPLNVGKPINSSFDDISIFINKEGTKGLFSSSREGGDDDIYPIQLVERLPDAPQFIPVIVNVKDDQSNVDLNDLILRFQEELELDEPIVKEFSSTLEVRLPLGKNYDMLVKKEGYEDYYEKLFVAELKPEDVVEVNILLQKTLENIEEEIFVATDQEEHTDKHKEVISMLQDNLTSKETSINQEEEEEEEEVLTSVSKDSGSIQEEESYIKDDHFEIKKYLLKGKINNQKSFILPNIQFGNYEIELNRKAEVSLKHLATLMLEFPEYSYEISSHTSSLGDDEDNMKITTYRTASILQFLNKTGLPEGQLSSKALGETKLLNNCGNNTVCSQQEHQLNDRVELRIMEQ